VTRDTVGQQVGLARRVERARVLRGEPVGIQRQIAAVGRERVGAQAILDPQRVDEAVDRRLAGLAGRRAQRFTPA
jgi:hypothetical protein